MNNWNSFGNIVLRFRKLFCAASVCFVHIHNIFNKGEPTSPWLCVWDTQLFCFWCFVLVLQVWSTVRAIRTEVHCVLWSINLRFVGTRSAPWRALCSQASDYTQARYSSNTLHTHAHALKLHQSLKALQSLNVYCVCLFSSRNSTDWCTYSLQRRKVNTSTNTIDRKTRCHKVGNPYYTYYTQSVSVFRVLTFVCHALKKRRQTRIPRRRRKRGMMILTARKRRKTRRKRR